MIDVKSRKLDEGIYRWRVSGIKDFNGDHIFDCGQCFRWRRLPNGKWYGIASKRLAEISYEKGTLEITEYYGNACRKDFNDFWVKYLDLDRDYGVIKRKLSRGDEVMKKAVKYGSGIRLLRQDLWETILSFIISQNNNIPRIKGCIENLADLAGEGISGQPKKRVIELNKEGGYGDSVRAAGLIPKGLPGPEKLASMSVRDLAPVKLGYRADYIIKASREVCERGLPETMEDVMGLTGVGPKVANCIALFGMEMRDSFPIDVWVKRVMNELYGFKESDVKGMERFAANNFGGLKGYAQQYLFYYIRSNNNLSQ